MSKHPVYHQPSWRELPRDGECAAEFLFGDAIGPCRGAIHRHHVDPNDPYSRSFQSCAGHHARIHKALRLMDATPEWKHCPHRHPYPEGREACERRLNRGLVFV